MKLYEINNEILNCVDLETGEIIDEERLEALQMEREQKIENIALWYKNLVSDAEQYKAEKQAFAEKEAAAKKKAESLKALLDRELSGHKFETIKVKILYRASEGVVIDDLSKVQKKFLQYEPKPDKTAIKTAIKSGVKVRGAHIEQRNNISIK